MAERIHDDEPDVEEPVVRALLAAECSTWAHAPIEYLATSGTDNAMWRVRLEGQSDVVVRLPRRPGAAAGLGQEMRVLEQLAGTRLGGRVVTPDVRHVGEPHDAFPYPWAVLGWLGGIDAWQCRDQLVGPQLDDLALDLAGLVRAVGALELDVRRREPGERGGPLEPLLDRLRWWLDDPQWQAADRIDVTAVRRLAAAGAEVVDEPVVEGVVHGDLIPGNLLLVDGRLNAVIDWGGAGWGDTAQDLAPAWSVLTDTQRPAFRDAMGVDEATLIRGRTFELEHAVGGVLYYRPRGHPLGDVMHRTLERILTEG